MRIISLIAALSLCAAAGVAAGTVGPDPKLVASAPDPPSIEQAAPAADDWAIEVLFEKDVVIDSAMTCAIFRSADGRTVGLMAPANLLVRIDDSTVVGVLKSDAVGRCGPTLKRNGVILTTAEIRPVERWSGRFVLPKGARLRA